MSSLDTPNELSPTDRQMVWALNRTRVTAWRAWDGEGVVYDDFSGDTLKLDVVMAEVFKRLQDGAACPSELAEHLATVLDLETSRRLTHVTEVALRRLAERGLAEPQEAGDAAPKRG